MMTSFRVTFFVLGWRENDICCVEDVEEDEAARAREESPDGRLRTRNCCARDARMIARKNARKKPECKGMHKTSGEINTLVLFFSSFYCLCLSKMSKILQRRRLRPLQHVFSFSGSTSQHAPLISLAFPRPGVIRTRLGEKIQPRRHLHRVESF